MSPWLFVSDCGHADHAELAEGVKLIAASLDLLDPVLADS
jgi:hypothetical protein